jgi:hypothetical protein
MRIYRISIFLCGVILFITGILKFLDVTKSDPYFEAGDILLPFLTNKQLMLIAGSVEIGVAIYLWMADSLQRRSVALLWFVITVAAYKLGHGYMHDALPCSCLGILGRLLKFSPAGMNRLTWLILFVLAAPSVTCLVHLGVRGNDASLSIEARTQAPPSL